MVDSLVDVIKWHVTTAFCSSRICRQHWRISSSGHFKENSILFFIASSRVCPIICGFLEASNSCMKRMALLAFPFNSSLHLSLRTSNSCHRSYLKGTSLNLSRIIRYILYIILYYYIVLLISLLHLYRLYLYVLIFTCITVHGITMKGRKFPFVFFICSIISRFDKNTFVSTTMCNGPSSWDSSLSGCIDFLVSPDT